MWGAGPVWQGDPYGKVACMAKWPVWQGGLLGARSAWGC